MTSLREVLYWIPDINMSNGAAATAACSPNNITSTFVDPPTVVFPLRSPSPPAPRWQYTVGYVIDMGSPGDHRA